MEGSLLNVSSKRSEKKRIFRDDFFATEKFCHPFFCGKNFHAAQHWAKSAAGMESSDFLYSLLQLGQYGVVRTLTAEIERPFDAPLV